METPRPGRKTIRNGVITNYTMEPQITSVRVAPRGGFHLNELLRDMSKLASELLWKGEPHKTRGIMRVLTFLLLSTVWIPAIGCDALPSASEDGAGPSAIDPLSETRHDTPANREESADEQHYSPDDAEPVEPGIGDTPLDDRPGTLATPPSTPPPEEGLVVHEWGTFTSMQGTNGVPLEGMHHEEEKLPGFVHGRQQKCMASKCLDFIPEGVTQKMETPVLYFYSNENPTLTVKVDFPLGILSEWYPDMSAIEPPLKQGANPNVDVANGSMTWTIELVEGPGNLPFVTPDDIWAPSRNVNARTVRVGNEEERFIFYRGLGRFTPPVRVVADKRGFLTIHNDSDQDIPAVFVLSSDDEGGAVQSLGAIPAKSALTGDAAPTHTELADYLDAAPQAVQAALETSGLTEDEAWSMVDTWSKSYFLSGGLRVLYILPAQWTDEILPLTITPTPDSVVRTLVGRIEVLTPAEEAATIASIEAHASGAQTFDLLSRFAEPRLRRACDLMGSDHALAGTCVELIKKASVLQPLF